MQEARHWFDYNATKVCKQVVRCRLHRHYIFLASLTTLCCLFYLIAGLPKTPTFSLKSLGSSLLRRSLRPDTFCGDSLPIWQSPQGNVTFPVDGSIVSAYENSWVGFKGFEHVACRMAMKTSTPNKLYPSKVNRTYPSQILEDAKNCSHFVQKYGFRRYPRPTREEENFPIAYIILFHKDLDQFLLLLRAIYFPHNVYCLSVDTKSSLVFHSATRLIAHCLPNVFVSSKLEDIVYAGMSRMMADLNCFRDLMEHPVKWQYIINSPGQQFPLKTNLQMVQILKLFAGTNDILGTVGQNVQLERHENVHRYVINETTELAEVVLTEEKHAPPPAGVPVVKCSAYGCFSRPFVHYVLTSRLAHNLLEWSKPIYSPDESYWGMLNYNKVDPAPGGFLGKPDDNPWLTSFSLWKKGKNGSTNTNCLSGYFVRDVCIFSPADLPRLVSTPYLFANKFYITHYPAALHCLDQRLFNNTISRETVQADKYRKILRRRLSNSTLVK